MIRRRLLPLIFALPAIAPIIAAAPQDLGEGLSYARITDLAKDSADLHAALGKEAAIIDLRNATGTPDALAQLARDLNQPATGAHAIRLILINPTTAADVVAAVSVPHPRQLTIGPKSPALQPDVAVSTTVEQDRDAYTAGLEGTPIEKLTNGNPEKRRFDEAALARTHNGAAAAAESQIPDGEDADPEPPKAPPPPAPAAAPVAGPRDLVLARAIQIHRALLAVKK